MATPNLRPEQLHPEERANRDNLMVVKNISSVAGWFTVAAACNSAGHRDKILSELEASIMSDRIDLRDAAVNTIQGFAAEHPLSARVTNPFRVEDTRLLDRIFTDDDGHFKDRSLQLNTVGMNSDRQTLRKRVGAKVVRACHTAGDLPSLFDTIKDNPLGIPKVNLAEALQTAEEFDTVFKIYGDEIKVSVDRAGIKSSVAVSYGEDNPIILTHSFNEQKGGELSAINLLVLQLANVQTPLDAHNLDRLGFLESIPGTENKKAIARSEARRHLMDMFEESGLVEFQGTRSRIRGGLVLGTNATEVLKLPKI